MRYTYFLSYVDEKGEFGNMVCEKDDRIDGIEAVCAIQHELARLWGKSKITLINIVLLNNKGEQN